MVYLVEHKQHALAAGQPAAEPLEYSIIFLRSATPAITALRSKVLALAREAM